MHSAPRTAPECGHSTVSPRTAPDCGPQHRFARLAAEKAEADRLAELERMEKEKEREVAEAAAKQAEEEAAAQAKQEAEAAIGGVINITEGISNLSPQPKENHISNLQKLLESKWSKPATYKSSVDFDSLSENEVEELLQIYASAEEVKGKENPHKLFKKQIVKVIGRAGSDHKHWKIRGVTGMAAHRIYHQLFKIQKKIFRNFDI